MASRGCHQLLAVRDGELAGIVTARTVRHDDGARPVDTSARVDL